MLPRECISNPVVLSLMVDTPFDGHWIDGSTLGMLSALTKSVEQTGKCTFNSSEPLFLVPQKCCYCSLVLKQNLDSNQKDLFYIYNGLFRYNLHYCQARAFTDFTFHEPRMEYRCAKLLYLLITVTTGLKKQWQTS